MIREIKLGQVFSWQSSLNRCFLPIYYRPYHQELVQQANLRYQRDRSQHNWKLEFNDHSEVKILIPYSEMNSSNVLNSRVSVD